MEETAALLTSKQQSFLRQQQRLLTRQLSELIYDHELTHVHPVYSQNTCSACQQAQALQLHIKQNSSLLCDKTKGF